MMKFFKKIRWQLLAVMLPIGIIPIVLILIVTMISNYRHLEKQSKDFDYSILNQVSINLDYFFSQYRLNLDDIVKVEKFVKFINAPQFRSAVAELSFQANMSESDQRSSDSTIWLKAMSHIRGDVCVVQSDRWSYVRRKPYLINYFSNRDFVLDYYKLIHDPLYRKLRHDRSEIVFGKLREGVINGYRGEEKSAFIYPYYTSGAKFKKFILVVLDNNFVYELFTHIDKFQLGTLYVLDSQNNIIAANHPSDYDFYKYDRKKKKYTQTLKDASSDLPEDIKFEDYKLLNTNHRILRLPKIRRLIDKVIFDKTTIKANKASSGALSTIINYKNVNYLAVVDYAKNAECKLVFFHPLTQIRRPIYNLLKTIMAIILLLAVVVGVVSVFMSESLTRPIIKLSDVARKNAKGSFKLVNIKSENEIGELANIFNKMIIEIEKNRKILVEKERMEKELEIAKLIQMALLPDLTSVKKINYDLDAIMIPATEVGGDYYDLIKGQDGRLWYGIGDVSGHGLQSGLIMMMAQTSANTIIREFPSTSAKDLVIKLNATLTRNIQDRLKLNHFMTLSFLASDNNGNFEYAGAHLDLVIYRKKLGKCEMLKTTGIWLGILPDISDKTEEAYFHLDEGDVLVLFTDGVIEAMDKSQEQFNMTRLVTSVEKYYSKGVKGIVNGIVADLKKFMESQKDDITVFAMMKKNESNKGSSKKDKSISDFPKSVKCPICNKKLKAPKPGKFKCSGCNEKTVLKIDEAGNVTIAKSSIKKIG